MVAAEPLALLRPPPSSATPANAADAAASKAALSPAGGAWDAAGDQLFLDWDLSPEHLSTGDTARIGRGGRGSGDGGDNQSGDGHRSRDGADGESN